MEYIISGKVIRGDDYGKKIGFPTINLDRRGFVDMKKKPKFGVYAGTVLLAGVFYKAGIVIGPLDAKKLPKVEAHLIGYNGNAYGQRAVIEIKEYIRKYNDFQSERGLIAQINEDLRICKKIKLR
ncbi:MAG: riboflavin kinase [bacterium]|nr:riboflavin kinase [bacterium]